MWSRNAIRDVVPLALLIMAGAVPGLDGWAGPRPARSQATAGPAAADAGRQAQSPDEKAIREADETFAREYNRADSKALASLFTEDAEVAEADGSRYQGRDLIEQSFAETFALNKGAKIAFEIATIRFLNPDAAKEEGRSLLRPAAGAPVSRLYTVLYVKRDGRWLISSVREELDPLVRPHDRLKDLEWMVGSWVDEEPDSVARFDCRWSEDGNFLIRTFTLKWAGKPVMTGTQRIGWDPLARQFRSWDFDSEGGFGEGRWSRDGERWVVKHSTVRPEGTTASATNIMTRVRPDMVRWVSTERVLGGESVPEDDAYVLVRVLPEPHLNSKVQATSPASPDTERSPR
jgi:uncharacterized protein (TIGR02246 family)